ncbi:MULTISPECIES: VOC family protein [unclassified Novosphingobium]|uniref:VOC family protein n=1 Tax=unclassified Novosphingobium TaxID=2644732 RepID=UPI00086AD9D6|nr:MULTISPECIES: VOC family protein [unclassified Novosphingobium]NKI98012.1 lactoylglutathione lyase [Novosphingobium sp. SG707]ODU81980.1 MAG: lactoylglutathione lyase [Novosphingobium sp. SCN 63-17]OJX96704.1 MAG: lactoylglutathione lyase [Novosphingobium sp. 63-713]
MAKIIHAMIRVLNEQKSLDFYQTCLGLSIADRYPFDGFTLVYLRNAENDMEIELTVNHDRSEPYTHGDGYGHIAIAVDDLDGEHARLAAAGIAPQPIKEFFREGALMARFFFILDPDGYKIEVLQRLGRYQ